MPDDRQSTRSEPRRVAITGAGSGIGRALALLLARDGQRLALMGRHRARLDQTRALCGAAADIQVHVVDVTDPAQVAHAFSELDAAWQGLDGLVNNAGVAFYGSAETTSTEDWAHVLAVNLTGPFLVSRAALPLLRRGRAAAIVNVASNLGLVGLKGAAAYCAAKGGLVNLTRSMALDHAGEGVRVNAVCPGVVATAMLDSPRDAAGDRSRRERELGALHPLGRVASPEEIAGTIAHLLSAEASYTTGSIVTVDGGMTAGFSK